MRVFSKIFNTDTTQVLVFKGTDEDAEPALKMMMYLDGLGSITVVATVDNEDKLDGAFEDFDQETAEDFVQHQLEQWDYFTKAADRDDLDEDEDDED